MTTPSIIAHRGYSALYRENSPAAWAGAVEANADHIEVDVRITRDGQIVCSHDDDLKRLTGRGDTISGSTDLELAKIEVDGSPAVPSLRLLFQTVPKNQSILLDVKDEQPRSLDILLTALAQEPDRELVLALHAPATVRYVRDAGWSRKILGLVTSADEEAFFNAGGDIVRIWEWDTAEGRIASHVSRGRPVWISTGDGSTGRRTGEYNSEELLRMFREGATGFSVNDPVSARHVFRDAAGE